MASLKTLVMFCGKTLTNDESFSLLAYFIKKKRQNSILEDPQYKTHFSPYLNKLNTKKLPKYAITPINKN